MPCWSTYQQCNVSGDSFIMRPPPLLSCERALPGSKYGCVSKTDGMADGRRKQFITRHRTVCVGHAMHVARCCGRKILPTHPMSTRAGCAGAPSRCACSTFSEAVVWQTRSKAALPYQKVWRGARAVRGARCRARCRRCDWRKRRDRASYTMITFLLLDYHKPTRPSLTFYRLPPPRALVNFHCLPASSYAVLVPGRAG